MLAATSGVANTSGSPRTPGTGRNAAVTLSPSIWYSTTPDGLGVKPFPGSAGPANVSDGDQTVSVTAGSGPRPTSA